MRKKWTDEQDAFVKFMHHAGQAWDEMSEDFYKMFKIKRSANALVQRFYKIQITPTRED
jgi:hypothetical protein